MREKRDKGFEGTSGTRAVDSAEKRVKHVEPECHPEIQPELP